MELVNEMYKIKLELPFGASRDVWRQSLQTLLQLLAPLAPHITEELWDQLGGEGSIHVSAWPKYQPELIKEDLVEIAIQVNGKLRGTVVLPIESTQEQIVVAAKDQEAVAKHLVGEIVKTIVVPRKLVNFVVKEK
jgi:leucyl-tRNA synthetase